jgi:glucan 1,3-beta-glucosidase
VYGSYGSKSTRRTTIILFSIGGLILFSVAIVLPVYFLVVKHTNNAADQHSNGTTGPSGSKTPLKSSLVTGGDGSTVMMEDGTTFTYLNSFGGYWYYDPDDPFNNGAQAQSWTPPLNQTFNYGSDRIRGCVPLLWYCHGITKVDSSG